ncbi:hypothetical protein L1887_04925 [Cichorium endivia]|nr:hypothetical protein L1887_04925 [Cichorium endivia]
MGKVGVITSNRKWINEEIVVYANDKPIRIGVVEYTDDWSPFKECPFDKTVESDEETEDDDDCDGISDTWEDRMMEEPEEEGEFRPERDVDPKSNSCENGENVSMGESYVQQSPENGTTRRSMNVGNQENIPSNEENHSLPKEVEEAPIDACDLNNFKNTSSPNKCGEDIDHVTINATNEMDKRSGPAVQLVSLGCFGPFPNNLVFTTQKTGRHPDQTEEWPRNRKLKRRRADSGGRSCSPRVRPIQNSVSPNQSGSIDLNCNPQKSHSSVPENNNDIEEEISNTIKIGAEIGFQIEEGNRIIAKAIQENGENTNIQ